MKSEARRALPRPSLLLQLEESRKELKAHFGKDGPIVKTKQNLERHLVKHEQQLGVTVRGSKSAKSPPAKEDDDAERTPVPE